MITLGVDAALNRTGLAVVRGDQVMETSTIKAKAKDTLADKLFRLAGTTEVVVERWVDGPIAAATFYVVIEKPGNWARGKVKSSQHTVEVLAMARAAIMLGSMTAGVLNEHLVQLPVNEARRLIIGFAQGATKDEVRLALDARGVPRKYLEDADQADAIVVALAGGALQRCGDSRFV